MGMLDSLKDAATNAALAAAQRMAPPDLSVFNDPLALQTKWTRMARSTSNIRIYQAQMLDERRLALKPTWQRHAIWLTIFAGGIGVVVATWPNIICTGGGAALAMLGAVILLRPKKILFDGQGKRIEGFKVAPTLSFHEIYAVQILQYDDGDHDGGSEQHELNLVLRNGKRIHVYSDPGLTSTREAAKQLGALIGCQVWDSTAVPKVKFFSLEDVVKFAEAAKREPPGKSSLR